MTYKQLTQQYKSFQVTGFYYNSKKRFSSNYTSAFWAFGINLWRGSVWGVDSSGKRKLLKRVFN